MVVVVVMMVVMMLVIMIMVVMMTGHMVVMNVHNITSSEFVFNHYIGRRSFCQILYFFRITPVGGCARSSFSL